MQDKKKILVLGATGSLGKYTVDCLCNSLPDEFAVIASGRKSSSFFDRYNIEYCTVDITKPETFSNIPAGIYAVVDCAGLLPARMEGYSPEQYFEVNTIGTFNILEYCKNRGIKKFIFTQTWADLNGYLQDNQPLRPYASPKTIYTGDHAVYAISKNAAVDLIKHYNIQYGLSAYIFRLPNIYLYQKNPFYFLNGQKKKSSYRILIDNAIEGKPMEVWGNPAKGKDIVYVKDFTQLVYKAILSDVTFGIYNVGTGVKTSMLDQVQGIIDVFCPDKKSEIIFRPDKPDCDDFVMDISNAVADLGYEPKYDYISYLKDFKSEMEADRF